MKGYTRFSPNSIYIFVYNIELGLSLFGEGGCLGLVGVGLGCLYGFFSLGLVGGVCLLGFGGGVAHIFLDICPRGLRYLSQIAELGLNLSGS